ncbi:MAG: TonB-dependent receptor [Bacteroidota bacterium]
MFYLIILCFAQSTYAQAVLVDEVALSYIANNKPLSLVLKELSDKSNVNIAFSERKIPANSKVSITAYNQPLGIILKAILEKRKCRYDIIGDEIVVSRISYRDLNRALTISGYVSDKKSGEMLVGANVYLFDKSKGTQTNEYGFYSLTLPKGTKRIYYSYLGYQQEVEELYLEEDVSMDKELVPDVQLNEIIILDDVENQEEPQTISQSKLNLDRIRTASSLLGESDIMRLVGMMPGVDSGADGMGGMNVRGGSADQNLVLLDGVPIYSPGHALGLFSVFNSNIIKNATLIKGNIPARYGGRLSSVLDIRTREGNNKKLSGDVTLSALALKGTVEGPIGSNGSSYIFSARRTLLDVYIQSITRFQNESNGDIGFSNYNFMDLNGKVNFKLSKKHRLLVSGFYGEDNFYTEKLDIDREETTSTVLTSDTQTRWDWGNRVFSAKLVSQYSKKTFGRLTAYYTGFDFDSFEKDDFTRVDTVQRRTYKAGFFKSAISDLGLKYDFDYLPNSSHVIRFGAGAIRHNFSPGLVAINNSDDLFALDEEINEMVVQSQIEETKLIGNEFFGYLEDEISIGYGTTINLGAHVNYTMTDEQTYLSIQPRVSLLARWDNAFFKVGVSRMNQYLHLLSSNGLGLPTDVWLPSTDELAPELSWIATAGVGYYNAAGFRMGIEGYYKLFDELTTFNEGGITQISATNDWEALLPVGTGSAYGMEVYFDHIIGRTTWNSNYTLAFSDREFADLNAGGNPFPFRFNRRHNLKLGFLHKITDNTEFTLNWNLSSGNPITEPSGSVIDVEGELLVVYLEKNGGLLPTYHRVDIGFNFYNKYTWGRTKLSLGLYNAFNRNNPFYTDIEKKLENPEAYEIVEFSILPIIPSIAYSVSF